MGNLIETAPSARSKCRSCQQRIDKGELRYGHAVPNAFGSGEALHWYHLECGAERCSEGFLPTLDEIEAEVPEREELRHLAELGIANPRWCRLARVERAPSGRARCQECRELIEKDALRVALERMEDGMVSASGFIHVGCTAKYAGTIEGLVDRFARTSPDLQGADRAKLTAELGA